MTSGTRRVRTTRQYPGEGESRVLIDVLNSELGPHALEPASFANVRVLLELVETFQKIARALRKTKRKRRSPLVSKEITDLFGSANTSLKQYVATPVLVPERMFDPETTSTDGDFSVSGAEYPQPFVEMSLILQIEKLASSGRILALKQCAHCHRWFFSRFSHQRFCSEKCKDIFHRSDPAELVWRRRQARDRYRIHRDKNVK